MKEYTPHPEDTSDVKLSEDMLKLTEKIAENVHEVWSEGRISDGWTWGEVRDDAKRQTPCLVPYSELPEREKDFDRMTAMETLKLIIKLGYEIRKKD
jgi:hypothetical protein